MRGGLRPLFRASGRQSYRNATTQKFKDGGEFGAYDEQPRHQLHQKNYCVSQNNVE